VHTHMQISQHARDVQINKKLFHEIMATGCINHRNLAIRLALLNKISTSQENNHEVNIANGIYHWISKDL
jgi:hypothetical protein